MHAKPADSIKGYSEQALIELLTGIWGANLSSKNVIKGIGDDAAVLSGAESDQYWLLTQDSVVAGIHFSMDDDPYRVGWKSLARSISDIAAMGGGVPVGALVCLGLPENLKVKWIQSVYDGIYACAQRYECPVIGGDVCSVNSEIFISVTVIGSVPRDLLCLRSGARENDLLCVTGTLGGSILEKHLAFFPRVRESQWLTKNLNVTSMIDLSDGIGKDLFHLAKESNAGFIVHYEKVPVSEDARKVSATDNKSAFFHAIHDGEDYELLFTVRESGEYVEKKCAEFSAQFSIPCTVIGEVTGCAGCVKLYKDNQFFDELHQGGFDHFTHD